ncbi:AbrB family transcriptional regulator [Lysinibacillus sp. 2017]|uniref:helix-turn-helix domain-containing protein n=1 Tax=unclassified Lysinibacillus TaxID=2636778 RepID=UPI000D529BE4|nr:MULTISPECIES: helix-turn-helix domain-containing protein [unclassified Lysinibacillus]AWE07208.1 AbrB family transcriptional regulator [Lysinibacillus sp. 2017]TGN34666.1 helix-turn-helix domain-containing protein [Lysinibacillus sp. S2017]
MINMNLKKLRMHHKLTQEELAFQLNVSRQVIAKWEKGESSPDLEHCQALAKLYNVTLDNLVNFDGEATDVMVPPKGKHFFGVAKMGERGQIVIPKKARDVFSIKPGDSLIFLGDEERGLAIVPEQMMNDFLNLLKTPLNVEDE